MSEATKAIFLSYASQDAEIARKICDTLRAAGLEVWFDQSELRGGDAWDQKIRRQIKECTLFVPVITPNTNARPEGYFRLEWKLAVDRSHLMADDAPFLFPIVVGDVSDATARVPDRFRDVQWTRLRLDETPAELAARIAHLLHGGTAPRHSAPPAASTTRARPAGRWQWWMIFPILGAAVGLAFAVKILWTPARPATTSAADPVRPSAPAQSEARLLAEKARALSLEKYSSSLDDYATAEGLLKRALELDQNDAVVWTVSSLFNTSIRTRGFDNNPARREAARSHAERAVKLAPDSNDARYALGRALRDVDHAAAEKVLSELLARDPNHTGALSSLAWIYDQDGQFDAAEKLYLRLRDVDPRGAALNGYLRFLLYFHYGRFEQADVAIRESLAAEPSTNSEAGLAMLQLTWKGDAAASANTLQRGTLSGRNEPRTIWVTAYAQLCQRAPDETLRTLSRLAADFIQDSWFFGPKAYFAARAHALAGRTNAAAAACEEALATLDATLKSTGSRDTRLRLVRGQLLAWLGRVDEARREAKTVEEIQNKGVSPWFDSPVLVYAALGDADAALPLLERLLQYDPQRNVGWPLTTALLKVDPIWDKLRGDVRFQRLIIAHTPPRDWPKQPELKRAIGLLDQLQMIPEDVRLAEEIVQRVLDQNPTNPEAVTAMARVHSTWLLRGWDRSTARYQKAKASAERALQLAPDEPEAHAALAIHLLARGAEPQRAVDLAQRAVDLCPQEPRFHRIRDNCLWVLHVPAGSVFLDKPQEEESEGLRQALASARRTVELFPQDAIVRYELSRHYRDVSRWEDFERTNEETLALAPVANALVWKARARFGLHGDLAGMKQVLDQVPARVRGIERTVFGYFVYAVFSGRPSEGIEALNALTEPWMIDFDFRGPKAMLGAALLELSGKKELARVQYEVALADLQRFRSLNAEDNQTYLNEAWIKYGLGRVDEARTALRVFNESLPRPYAISPMGTWWFQAIPANLLFGDREMALTLVREVAASSELSRATLARRIAMDPRCAALRQDAELQAIIAAPAKK